MEPKEYGALHSEWYVLMAAKRDHSRDVDFLARRIQESAQPVLELASGTDNVLVPLLERGFDISGIDTSQHMMDKCRAKLLAKGLKTQLHEQSMLEFALPQKYGVILLLSGGLGLFTTRE